MRRFYGLVLLISICFHVKAQVVDSAKLKVFIDCREGCDLNFIKTEIPIIDFVTDRLAADAHILVTAQQAGSGGKSYQMNVFGQNRFKNINDTLVFTTTPNATASEQRESFSRYLMLGLAPLIAKTVYVAAVKISMKEAAGASKAAEEKVEDDKWNYWVFNISASGNLSAEKIYKNNRVSSGFSADRVTDKSKVHFGFGGSLRNSIYNYDSTKYTVKNRDYGFSNNLVRMFGSHWSYGYQSNFSNNTFNNIKARLFFSPAIEFNIYDYKDVNSKFFVLRYGVDVTRNKYYEITIFDKLKETVYGHRFSAALSINQKWGSFNSGAYYRNFFHDWKLNTAGINAKADVKLTGSLSFFVNVDANIAHNQINLVKGGATEKEILTRKRQLASNYNYSSSFGLTYRFGSILNNFVNPSFDGYGGF